MWGENENVPGVARSGGWDSLFNLRSLPLTRDVSSVRCCSIAIRALSTLSAYKGLFEDTPLSGDSNDGKSSSYTQAPGTPRFSKVFLSASSGDETRGSTSFGRDSVFSSTMVSGLLGSSVYTSPHSTPPPPSPPGRGSSLVAHGMVARVL